MSPAITVGTRVCLKDQPTYLKTADAMSMLRPPDLVDVTEVGQVVALRALEQVAVRFRRGSFLFDSSQLIALDDALSD
ncbi:MAG: NAD(P)H dehydrogenase assembly family protein [Vulcanococcus sp.]